MKKNIFKHTWTIVAAVIAGTISTLIVNSYTRWWAALANATYAGWEAGSQATSSALTYRLPIWIAIVIVAFVTLIWYATRKIGRRPKANSSSSNDFLTYRQDFFDGVLCRWEYSRTYGSSKYQIGDIVCFCQHCEFAIGTPNVHSQQCSSCLRRAVRSDNPPFWSYGGREITGYRLLEPETGYEMTFEEFIRREIDRRIRTGEWQSIKKS